MDSFTVNKIAGAFLGTCLVGMGIGIVAQGIYAPEAPKKPGFALPNPKPEAAAGSAQPAETPLPVLLAKADAKRGEKAAQVCAACHNFNEGGGNKIGPDLYGVVNRDKGSVAGYDYSDGLKKKGGKWTFADLDVWLKKPSAYIPGTKMGYPGEDSPEKRADIIVYLNQNSKDPAPLPKPTEGEKSAQAGAAAPAAGDKMGAASGGGDFAKLVATADPAKGKGDAQICGACHNLQKGGGVLVGPPLWNVVDRDVASVPGFDYSAGLKKLGGKWTYDALNKWLTNPAADVPGTKMGYPGEANEKKRAAIVAYLRTLADKPAPLPGAGGDAGKADEKPAQKTEAAPPAPAAKPEQKTEAAPAPAKPEQKAEAAPAAAQPEQKADAGAATSPMSDMASADKGPEPYAAADPQAPAEPAAAASQTLQTAAATVDLGTAGDAPNTAPEPYSAPSPDDAH